MKEDQKIVIYQTEDGQTQIRKTRSHIWYDVAAGANTRGANL